MTMPHCSSAGFRSGVFILHTKPKSLGHSRSLPHRYGYTDPMVSVLIASPQCSEYITRSSYTVLSVRDNVAITIIREIIIEIVESIQDEVYAAMVRVVSCDVDVASADMSGVEI